MLKSAIRKEYLKRRRDLPPSERARYEAAIIQHFCRLDLSQVLTLHLFLPIEKNYEFNTWPIVHWLQQYRPAIRLVVPRLGGASATLEHVLMLPSSVIVLNKWGIPEPADGEYMDARQIDLCLIPLLAIDPKGQRVGYGGGYYDRFLAACRPDLQTVGISIFEPVSEISDTEPYDIPLGSCLFPSGHHYFR